MKTKKTKVGFADTFRIAFRAMGVSVHAMGTMPLVFNFVGFAIAFLPLYLSRLLAQFTDQVQAMSHAQTTLVTVLATLGFLIVLYLIQATYNALAIYVSEVSGRNIEKFIKETIIDSTSTVKFKYIENEGDYRNKIAFAQDYGGIRVAQSIQKVIIVLQSLITFVTLTIALINVSMWIVAAILITCVPAVILSILQKDEEYKNTTKNMTEGAYSVHLYYMCAGANERCKPLMDVRFTNVFPYLKQKWRDVSDDYILKKNKMTRKHVLFNSIADILRNVVYIVVLLIAARKIYENPALGIGMFMLVFTMSGQLQTATTKLFTGVTEFFGQISYMKDFFDLRNTPSEIYEKNPETLKDADIKFENVSFSYPGNTREVLTGINVSIKQGEKIAVVGENGSGKTTFINLLCGIYEPTIGTVKVSGKPVNDHLGAVRNALSVVFQNFGRYETTIRENITIALPQNTTDEKVLEIAKKTGASEFIKSQPRGLSEQVGTFSDTGNNLSGGQWQKVALTRALLRENSRIIVLDEPTAALDPVAEAQLYRDFEQLTEDKTTILISHRLGITSVVDRILVFDNGRIVEDGSHAALMEHNGQYAKMYRAQAQWYADSVSV